MTLHKQSGLGIDPAMLIVNSDVNDDEARDADTVLSMVDHRFGVRCAQVLLEYQVVAKQNRLGSMDWESLVEQCVSPRE